MISVDCVADLHGHKPELPGGDLLIVAGDLTARDEQGQHLEFAFWLEKQKYTKKILIGGNHDGRLEKITSSGQTLFFPNVQCDYLFDSGTEFKGLKIWGSPWTPLFNGVNKRCRAFMKPDLALSEYFDMIPEGLDILITHGPMKHILDANHDGYACGSQTLREAIDRARPRFHVFGHIHENGNSQLMYKHEGLNTWCVNCSYCDENYQPVNSYIRLEI